MSLLVDPNKFVVPYAVAEDDGTVFVFHIKDGRPKAEHLKCPYCSQPVSFIAESDTRSAHFRHHDRSECDKKHHYLRTTIHDDVVRATVELLNGRYTTNDICKNHAGVKLPTGFAVAEKTATYNGKTYRPDVTVEPRANDIAATLELEVIFSNKPTPDRLMAAAEAGRAIGVLDVTKIERQYIQRLHQNEGFDLPEAIKEYIVATKYSVLTDIHIKRAIRGIVDDRIYLAARVERRHQDAKQGATFITPSPTFTAPPQPFVTPRPMARQTPSAQAASAAPTCARCGESDWSVSITNLDGKKYHVLCWKIEQNLKNKT